ncbi:MAG TPA: methylenetetrahydrofolate reductase [Solirubrobacteraceae bacterium]|jgi:methylenetetrahydrofolate reductase (NADPH)|nr:methylenetetrahydrofolate reductase [Solirubrobacteraceae bacterium]
MSGLERKLTAREFVVTAELPVIDGGGQAEIIRQLAPMRPFVDAFNATDNPSAHAHCSPLAVSIGLLGAGVEPVMQLACRDRNRLALEADLVGAAMHGIENICCLTGDDVTAGDEPEARRVFDLDGPQLIALARLLENGTYLSGRAIEPPPHYLVGAVENPGAPPYEYRVRRAAMKALAGARFLQLQICYRPELLARFLRAAHDTGLSRRLALIPSICILRSVGGMRFVATRVPGIDMPPETLARVENAKDAEAECFEIAYELASHALAQPGVAGLHFISFRKDAGIAKLCTRLGIPPRAERETNGYSASLAV